MNEYGYLSDLRALAEALDGLMADLEDVRDDAQDVREETGDEAIGKDVQKIDAALALLAQAASLLED